MVATIGPLSTAYVRPVLAQTSPLERERAKEQFQVGIRAARSGEWDIACQAFETSYQLLPRAVALINLAGACGQTGRLVHAKGLYEQFLESADGEGRPAMREAAKRALAELEERIPTVRISVRGRKRGDKTFLDGVLLDPQQLRDPIQVDPGVHEVVHTRLGHPKLRMNFAAEEGLSHTVDLDARPEAWRPSALPEVPKATGSTEWVQLPTATAAARERGRPSDRKSGASVFRSPWFWTAVGGALAVGAAAFILVPSGEDSTRGNLAPFRIGIE